ncbi:MAG: ABC transporter substrate-binding protein, partial [Hyphomicrobiales bacterium]
MSESKVLKNLIGLPRISRREFIVQAVAAGVTATTAMSFFDKAHAAEPKKGGDFRQGLTGGATSDTLDPAQTLDSFMINVSSGQLRNNLTEISPEGELIPELAESWEASPDAKTWTFKLRKGVEFHSGKTLEAADVVASLNHHRGEETKSAAKGIVKPITDVKADGKDTVVVTLEGGSADFPFLVSDYHLTICEAKDDGKMAWEKGEGTGGYMLEKFEPGVTAKLKRNPNYWKEGRAYFDTIENLFIADVVARTAALRAGEIHAMSNLDLKTAHLLERDTSLNVFDTTGNKHATLPMNTKQAPFDNNDLRLALKFAINREEALKKILKGKGEIANDSPVGPANVYRATPEELPQRPYDPEKAKFHLKKAGMENAKLQLHLADTAFEGAVDMG